MPKLISLHTISFGGDDKIPPQHVFEATAEEQEFLQSRQAVRKFNAEQDKQLPVHQRPGAKASTSTAQTGESTLPDVSKANKDKLLEIAATEQVEGLTGEETVAQLREAILASRKAKEDSLV